MEETKKVRVGVVGVGRGGSMIKYSVAGQNAELVAICDIWEEGLERKKKQYGEEKISYYTSFDEFLKHDMDAVVLANYATEHAPFAIKAMEAGFHVLSECLPVQTMAEAVALVECVERTGKKYCFLENACYMGGTMEMKRLYADGVIGEFEYGEGEYVHNCENIWPQITHGGERDHWRNQMYATFYCTHSIGPLVTVTGLRPKSVVGFQLPNTARMRGMGRQQGLFGIELIRMENGGVFQSKHGELYSHSLWWNFYGSKGRMETAREDMEAGNGGRVCLDVFKIPGEYDDPANHVTVSYVPKDKFTKKAKNFGHLGADFYCLWNAFECILGNPEAKAINVYQALDMFLPGMFAHFSILEGGKELEIPDLRDAAQREKYRNDNRCTNKEKAGDQWVPPYSWDCEPIGDEVYAKINEIWEAKGRP